MPTTRRVPVRFLACWAGQYTLQIEAPGFKRYQSGGIVLAAAQNVRQSYTPELSDVSETVTVEGRAPLLNTVASDQRESLSELQIKELPIARRNFANLLSVGTGIETANRPPTGPTRAK